MMLQAYDKDLYKWFDVVGVDFDDCTGQVARVHIKFYDGQHYKILGKNTLLKWFVEPGDRVIKIAPKIKVPPPIKKGV